MAGVKIDPWQIHRQGPIDDFSQSLFCLGNGFLGVRGFGCWEEKKDPQDHGFFRAGLFEQVKPGITDMVQLPDVLTLRPSQEMEGQVTQTLDMSRGILTQSIESQRISVLCERAVSMADAQLILQRVTITAKEAGTFAVESVADQWVRNLPVHDDQMLEATEAVQLLEAEELTESTLRMHTRYAGHEVALYWTHHSSREAQAQSRVAGGKASTRWEVSLRAGEQWTVEKRIRVLVRAQAPNPDSGEPWLAHERAWDALWRDCDIELDADGDLQGAVRYNIFQLLCNNAAEDPTVSIGARGLTHGRYKGNTFWDTEIFLLPFYLWTRPQAARNLLLYRTDRLEAAQKLAGKQNLEGARYPWMSADSGDEQCESWDIGLCETHVTADIAYALDRYAQTTGDPDFARETAAIVWLETARYWRSRLTWEPRKGQYSSFFVKGPDEYCGVAVNNTFTNYLARHNVRLALRYANPPEKERERLAHLQEHIAILYDSERNLYLQDELLERLEEAPFLKRENAPAYRTVCFDRMQRYRVLKQADLVLLMTMFPNDFTREQKQNVFAYYEPITLHDSTLSYGVHAQLALQLGLWEKAEAYLQKAVYLDLRDVMSNTGREGIHMAALGSAWQALVMGAAGLWCENGALTVQPNLPQSIRSMRFHVFHHGKRFCVTVSHDGHCVQEEV